MPLDLTALARRVVAAPVDDVSTPRLVAEVTRAGGLGILAGGERRSVEISADVAVVRQETDGPFGVSLNLAEPSRYDFRDVDRYAGLLRPSAERYGVELGDPAVGVDVRAEQLDAVCHERVPVVSFSEGLPPGAVIERVHRYGGTVLVTVTTPGEAVVAEAAGADGLVVQGIEAGGHRGGFTDVEGVGEIGLLTLLRLVAHATDLPMVAAGGIADGAGMAAALVAGAVAVQLSTAFLLCPEAATDDLHRAAVGSTSTTVLTRAFTGRRARVVVNGLVTRHDSVDVPAAYPQVCRLTAPLRRAARDAGDAEYIALWAGQAHPLARALPAGELVRRLSAEAAHALSSALSGVAGGSAFHRLEADNPDHDQADEGEPLP